MTPHELDLTQKQRAAFTKLLSPLKRDRTYTSLAEDMLGAEASASSVKSLSGYVGEAFKGAKRGLVHVFGDERRLEALANALGNGASVEVLQGFVAQARADAPDTSRILASGLEDAGELPLSDVFVLPLVTRNGIALSDTMLEEACFSTPDKPLVCVTGQHGSGVSTLIQRAAEWGLSRGYTLALWDGRSLPTERGVLLLINDIVPSQLEGIETWAKAGDRRVVAGLSPKSPLSSAHAQLHVGPVDAAWLNTWCGRVRQLPRRTRRWLPEDPRPLIHRVLAHRPQLGPEAATTLLRWACEHPNNARLDPISALEHALIRRAQHQPSHAHPSRAALVALRTGSVLAALKTGACQEVREDLQNSSISAASRRILEEALTTVDTSELTKQSLALGLIRETSAGLETRFASLLQPVEPQPSPEEIIEVFEAAASRKVLATWLDAQPARNSLPWSPLALCRCLAVRIVTQDARLPRSGTGAYSQTKHGSQPAFCSVEDTTVQGLRAEVDRCSKELGVPIKKLDDEQLALHLALASTSLTYLHDPRVWRAAEERSVLPQSWVERLLGTEDLVPVLLDPWNELGGKVLLTNLALHRLAVDILEDFAHRDPAAFGAWFSSTIRRLTLDLQEAPNDDHAPAFAVLTTLDDAIAARPVRQALHHHSTNLKSDVVGLLNAVPIHYWMEEPPKIKRLVQRALPAQARKQQLEVANNQDNVVVGLVALTLVDEKELCEVLIRVNSGAHDLVETDPVLEARKQLVQRQALMRLSLAALKSAWTGVEAALDQVVRSEHFAAWASWPAAIEYSWSGLESLDENHPVWQSCLKTSQSLTLLARGLPSTKVDKSRIKPRTLRANTSDFIDDRVGMLAAFPTPSLDRWDLTAEQLDQFVAAALAAPSVDHGVRLLAGLALRAAERVSLLTHLSPASLPSSSQQEVRALLAVLLDTARAEDPQVVDDWLLGLLRERPALADHDQMRPAWAAWTGRHEEVVEWLLSSTSPTARGDGVLSLFGSPHTLEQWLHRSQTQAAAREHLLLLDGDGWTYITEQGLQKTPSLHTLRKLRREGKLDRLIDASVNWDDSARRALWAACASLYSRPVRTSLVTGQIRT